jgi:hypothetical protein
MQNRALVWAFVALLVILALPVLFGMFGMFGMMTGPGGWMTGGHGLMMSLAAVAWLLMAVFAITGLTLALVHQITKV